MGTMKTATLLTWITQFGLSIAVPPAMFILLAVWLKNEYGWGSWVIWVGVAFGVIGAVQGFVTSIQAMNRLTEKKKEQPPLSFNDHE